MVEFGNPAKPLKSFFGAARPNWDQLGWVAPLHNIVLASVGPMVCSSHEYNSFLQPPPSSQFSQGPPPVKRGPELFERGAQRGFAPA